MIELRGEVKDRFLEVKRELGLTDNTEVLRLIINQYLMDVLVDPSFVEWFCTRHPRLGVMKLSEVIEEYELYKRQKATG